MSSHRDRDRDYNDRDDYRHGGSDYDSQRDTIIYVGDVPKSVTKEDIEKAFRYYGKLKKVWLSINPGGFGFVEFYDPRDAEDSVRGLDGKSFGNGRLRVEISHGKGRTRGGTMHTRPQQRYFRRPPEYDRCFICNKIGHYTYNCPNKRDRRSRSRSTSRDRSRRHRRSDSRESSKHRSRNDDSRENSKHRDRSGDRSVDKKSHKKHKRSRHRSSSGESERTRKSKKHSSKSRSRSRSSASSNGSRKNDFVKEKNGGGSSSPRRHNDKNNDESDRENGRYSNSENEETMNHNDTD